MPVTLFPFLSVGAKAAGAAYLLGIALPNFDAFRRSIDLTPIAVDLHSPIARKRGCLAGH